MTSASKNVNTSDSGVFFEEYARRRPNTPVGVENRYVDNRADLYRVEFGGVLMNVADLRVLARYNGVMNPDALSSEKQLVWAIQKIRGENTCFLSDTRASCRDWECEWRSECIRLVAEWRR